MKSDRLKKTLLAILIIVAGYIWWGNIQTFNSDSPSSYRETNKSEAKNTSRADGLEQLKYVAPRINPFSRPPTQTRSEKQLMPQNLLNNRHITENKPSSTYKLGGFVLENKKAQAIFIDSKGLTLVLTIQDSLADWELHGITNNSVVFRKDTLYDTLRLETSVK